MKETLMRPTDGYRDAVLLKIAGGRNYTKSGQVTYKIDGKLYHIKVKTGQRTRYPFNINPTVLAADFEVYVCGDYLLYYLLPVKLIKEMHSDPSAMPDNKNPGYTIIDVCPGEDEIVYGTGGKSLKIGNYRNLTA
jgi:hypothetical protein